MPADRPVSLAASDRHASGEATDRGVLGTHRPLASPDDSTGALSRKQREALRIICEHGYSYVDEEGQEGVVTSGPTCLIDGQPWINWRTALALERRGLAEIRGIGEEQTVWAK